MPGDRWFYVTEYMFDYIYIYIYVYIYIYIKGPQTAEITHIDLGDTFYEILNLK